MKPSSTFCAQEEKILPLSQYFLHHAKGGGPVFPDDYLLLPITATALGYLTTSSDCMTDCMLELRSKYREHTEDEWGGHMEEGWREVGVIGFDVR